MSELKDRVRRALRDLNIPVKNITNQLERDDLARAAWATTAGDELGGAYHVLIGVLRGRNPEVVVQVTRPLEGLAFISVERRVEATEVFKVGMERERAKWSQTFTSWGVPRFYERGFRCEVDCGEDGMSVMMTIPECEFSTKHLSFAIRGGASLSAMLANLTRMADAMKGRKA